MFSVNEGGEYMEVVVGGVESNEDSSVGCSKSEDNCSREIAAVCWEGGGEGHGEGVQVDKGDWKGDGSSSGRNSGSFMIVNLTAVGWVA